MAERSAGRSSGGSAGQGPEVSVLVLTYNQEEFLAECLEGLLAQDHPDFEVVVTDDASTDGTVAVAKRFAKDHPNLRILTSDRNLGIAGNGNRGLRACRGAFVAALGGDDVAFPGKLSAQAGVLRARPDVTLCYHDMEVFHHDSTEPPFLYSTFRRPRQGGAKELVRHGNFIVGSSPMFRRSAIPPHGLLAELPVMNDWFFDIEVARQGRIAYIPRVLGRYRRHPASVMARGLSGKDPLTTLDLVEERFPELARHARWRRGELLRREARKAARDDPRKARELARQALRQRKLWPPREAAWLMATAAGRHAGGVATPRKG